MQWNNLIHLLPTQWQKLLPMSTKQDKKYQKSLLLGDSTVCLDNIKCKHVYRHLINNKCKAPTAQVHIERRVGRSLEWNVIYTRIYKTTIDAYLRYFRYKIVNNILYLNKDLHKFKIVESPRCTFCRIYMETIDHLFVHCVEVKQLYFQIRFDKQSWINTAPIRSVTYHSWGGQSR